MPLTPQAPWLIWIIDPAGAERFHGTEFREAPGDGNDPTQWPSRGLAQWTIEACHAFDRSHATPRVFQVIPADPWYADGAD